MGWVTTSAGNAHVNRYGMSWFGVPDITLKSTTMGFKVFFVAIWVVEDNVENPTTRMKCLGASM